MARLSMLTLCALLLILSTGCPSNNDNNTNNGANNTPDMTADTGSDEQSDLSGPPETYESDYQMVFTLMSFDNGTPGGGSSILNTVLKKSFSKTQEIPTTILIDIKDIPVDEGLVALKVRSGAGVLTAVDGEFKWDPETSETYYDGTLEKSTGQLDATFESFNFIATIPTEGDPLRVILPISDLKVDALVTATATGGLAIQGGKLKGYLTKEEADLIEIAVTPTSDPVKLTTLLKEEDLNRDLDNDGTNDAWDLTATFNASPAIIK